MNHIRPRDFVKTLITGDFLDIWNNNKSTAPDVRNQQYMSAYDDTRDDETTNTGQVDEKAAV